MTGGRVLPVVLAVVLVGVAVVGAPGGGAATESPASRAAPDRQAGPLTTTTVATPRNATTVTTTAPPAEVSLSARTEQSGGNATVVVELANTGGGDSVAPVVQVGSIPEGWRVVGQESPAGVWRSSTREWAWLNVSPGETATARLFLRAEGNTSDGGPVRLAVVDADDNTDTATADLEAVVANESSSGGSGGGVDPLFVAAAAGVLALAGLGTYLYRQR